MATSPSSYPVAELGRGYLDHWLLSSFGLGGLVFSCILFLPKPFAFTNKRIEELEVLLQSHVKILTEEHVSPNYARYGSLSLIEA